jgi:hypothetical protein
MSDSNAKEETPTEAQSKPMSLSEKIAQRKKTAEDKKDAQNDMINLWMGNAAAEEEKK